MRDLASLGISPAPWSEICGCVIAGRREGELGREQLCELDNAADARLIAAAPTMYKTLFDEYKFLNAIYEEMPNGQIEKRILAIADALAAASGESEAVK